MCPPAIASAVFATKLYSYLTSLFAVGSSTTPVNVTPFTVFGGRNGLDDVGVL